MPIQRHATRCALFAGLVALVQSFAPDRHRIFAADGEADAPSTCLFDTNRESTAALDAGQLAAGAGWTLVPEDQTAHAFRGDALVRNDRLILVLRRKGAGAELYGRAAAGAKFRAVLAPLSASDGDTAALAELRILENSPAAVALAATFRSASGHSSAATYRLTAGQATVEIRAGVGTEHLSVNSEARYVVVPDFFGDDMVFRAADSSRARLRLPAENFLLQMADDGRALVMCVWQSGAQGAAALRSAAGGQSGIAGCQIDAAKDQAVWIACLEGAGLWRESSARSPLPNPWNPPFPAKWRHDVLGADGESRAATPGDWQPADTALTYVMDRDQETPLTVFCPIDVLRSTLGVGPCQYILQTEGFAVETSPTPDSAMTWIERQFRRKKQKKSADEIRELLDGMVRHIEQVQTRIEAYGQVAREVSQLCQAASASSAAKSLGQTAARLERTVAAAHTRPTTAERAARLAAAVVALTGQDDGGDACERLGAEARAIGALQDRTLANCRMATRWLAQSAAMLAAEDPQAAELAAKVQACVQRMLKPSGATVPSPTH